MSTVRERVMKRSNQLLIVSASILTMLVSVQVSAKGPVTYDYAKVLEAEPITHIVRVSTPREECWQEQVVHEESRPRSATGAIFGGIIGAAVGNKLGHGKSNKRVGAVAGALLGSSIGNNASRANHRPHHQYTSTEERCRIYNDYHDEERITGYNVQYLYNGNTYSTVTTRHPGNSLKLKVAITPIL